MPSRRFRLCSFLLTASLVGSPALAATDLMAMQLEQLMEIGVVGASKYEQSQGDVAAAVSVITRQEIRAHGWRTLGEALSSLPGFTTTYDRQYVVPSFRGVGLPGDYATRVLVTLNGNRLNDPLYDQGPFGRMLPLDLALVERIEFIPGPGGAVYGQNAMFGVVNLVARAGADLDGVEMAVAGQQPQELVEGRLSWGQRFAGGTDLLLSASALEADGEDRFYDFGAAGVSGIATGLDTENDREVYARLRHGPWALDALYGAHEKGDPTANFFTDPLVPGKYTTDVYQQAQLAFQQAWRAGTLQLNGRVFLGHYGTEGAATSVGVPYLNEAEARWYGGEIQVVTTKFARHKLMLGVEGQVEPERKQSLMDLTNPEGVLLVKGEGYRIGVYGQDEWQLGNAVAATLGLRVDGNDSTDATLSPRAGLIWQATPAMVLKALYGRAHRAPNSFERDYADGVARTDNPHLSGEQVDTAELVGDFRVATDLALRISVYEWKLRDIVTLRTDPDSGLAQYQSGAPVEASGVELSGDRTWMGGARLRASLSLQDTRTEDGVRLANSPAWLGKVSYTQPLPWLGMQAAALWRYDSSRRTLGGSQLGGWGVTDLTLTAEHWLPQLSVALVLTNIFDRDYWEPASDTNWQDALDQDGRSVRLKIGYRF